MTKKDKNSETLNKPAEAGEERRSLIRHPLHTLAGLIAEACRVYRQMRDDKLDHQKGRSLIWSLGSVLNWGILSGCEL